MEEIKRQIRYESNQAVQLSQDAKKAFEAQNWEQGKALMKEAVAASGNCQKLIKCLFLQYFSPGKGDYTKERHQWLDDKSLDEVLREMEQFKEQDLSQYDEVFE